MHFAVQEVIVYNIAVFLLMKLMQQPNVILAVEVEIVHWNLNNLFQEQNIFIGSISALQYMRQPIKPSPMLTSIT